MRWRNRSATSRYRNRLADAPARDAPAGAVLARFVARRFVAFLGFGFATVGLSRAVRPAVALSI
jgi:hypothetical protein